MSKWILDEENNLVHEDDDRHTIICNFPCTLKNPSMKADALKVAAALDLLEALEGLLALAGPSCVGPWDVARAAVKKATGA